MSGGESLEIPVWVNGSEKWVTGVSKRTTCDDVIYALLCHVKRHRHDEPDVRDYGLYEGWMGVERPLQGRTKILKVWRAWGENSNAVTFTVRQHEPFTKPHEGYLAQASAVNRVRRRRSQRSTNDRERQLLSERAHRSTRDRSERERGMRSEHTERHKKSSKQSSERKKQEEEAALRKTKKAKLFQGFLNQVLEQEHRIKEQIAKIEKVEREISHYEKIVEKLETTQLDIEGPLDSSVYLKDLDQTIVSLNEDEINEFSILCDNIVHLDDTISHQMKTANTLRTQLNEESVLMDPKTHPSTRKLKQPPQINDDIHSLSSQLERSISLNLKQQDELRKGNETLQECDLDIQHKLQIFSRMEEEFRQEKPRFFSTPDASKLPNKPLPPLPQIEEPPSVPEDLTLTDSIVQDVPVASNATTSVSTPVSDGSSDAMFIDAGYLSQSTTTGEPSPESSPGDHSTQSESWKGRKGVRFLDDASASSRNLSPLHSSFYSDTPSTPSLCCVPSIVTQTSTPSHGYEYDSNSDTGLSSLHSSDECGNLLETLV